MRERSCLFLPMCTFLLTLLSSCSCAASGEMGAGCRMNYAMWLLREPPVALALATEGLVSAVPPSAVIARASKCALLYLLLWLR